MAKSKLTPVRVLVITFILIFLSAAVLFYIQNQPVPSFAASGAGAPSSETLEVHFIDVGQADCILIRTGEHSMLIDAGNNDDADLIVNYLKKQGISILEMAVGTHPHEDHIGSLDTVIERFEVKAVMMPRVPANTRTYEDVLDAVSRKNLKIKEAKRGVTFTLGDAALEILSPAAGGEYENPNNASAVIKLTFEGKSFLFCGDAEREAEDQILKNGANIKSDVLKVGHHGSRTSTSPNFLKAAAPEYGVISVGRGNSYGLPSQPVLDALGESRVQVFRTDEDGTIVMTVKNGQLSVKKEGKNA